MGHSCFLTAVCSGSGSSSSVECFGAKSRPVSSSQRQRKPSREDFSSFKQGLAELGTHARHTQTVGGNVRPCDTKYSSSGDFSELWRFKNILTETKQTCCCCGPLWSTGARRSSSIASSVRRRCRCRRRDFITISDTDTNTKQHGIYKSRAPNRARPFPPPAAPSYRTPYLRRPSGCIRHSSSLSTLSKLSKGVSGPTSSCRSEK